MVLVMVLKACAGGSGAASPDPTSVAETITSTAPITTTAPAVDPPATDPPSEASPSTTAAPSSTPPPTSSEPSAADDPDIAADGSGASDPLLLPATFDAFVRLSRGVEAASLSVWRDGEPVFQGAVGTDRAGAPLTSESPLVVASVGKLITALTVARLAERGALTVDAPVPWEAMGLDPHPGWSTVTVRDLLDHTSGMPVARQSWLDDPGTCADPLRRLLVAPPTTERGRWRYSNGNYCALGLLIEHLTGDRYDVAAHQLVFVPAGVVGPRLTVDGPAPGDGPYRRGIDRFDRLGAAGSWLAGTDHVAAVLARVTDADLETLRWPGIFLDEFGWGHTGTVAGARACAWVLEEGRTAVAVTIAGERPQVGGGLCDVVLPALATDLGLAGLAGLVPDRSPPSSPPDRRTTVETPVADVPADVPADEALIDETLIDDAPTGAVPAGDVLARPSATP